MFIAVPSYHRAILFGKKTYKIIKASQAEAITTVFVVQEELDEYKALYPDINFVVGLKGLLEQRKFIFDYYPEGAHILQMDDDIDCLFTIKKEKLLDIRAVAQRGFDGCVANGCRLWSLYPVSNHFFMKEQDTTSLKFCGGWFFGIIKTGDYLPLAGTYKEDVYRTCSYYRADKKVFRINDVSAKTKFLRGDSLDSSTEKHEEGANAVVAEFPWAKKYYRKNGFPEVRLRIHS
jgi:hypothetical protein